MSRGEWIVLILVAGPGLTGILGTLVIAWWLALTGARGDAGRSRR